MNPKSLSFNEVWSRIRAVQGQEFVTKTGKPFTFKVRGEVFRPSRTDRNITKRDFKIAFELVPCDGPGVVNQKVQGPAYIWAVLHDKRIRQSDW